MNYLLKPAELCYRALNRSRRALYRSGTLKGKRLPRPVISIGNLAMGGGGKTPTVIAIAEGLQKRGLRVVILTRGYGRTGTTAVEQVSAGDWSRFGDEPSLLHKRLPAVPVIVGADRHASGTWFLAKNDCDVFLLDDGFQHLQLERDWDVVLINATRTYLREGHAALRDADTVLRRGQATVPRTLEASVHEVNLQPSHLIGEDGAREEIGTLRNQKLVAFSALANNQQFFKLLESLGANLILKRSFRDHYAYAGDELSELRRMASAAGARLVTTEKDSVKLASGTLTLVVEMVIAREQELLDQLSQLVSKSRP